jgi:hypothetical protein
MKLKINKKQINAYRICIVRFELLDESELNRLEYKLTNNILFIF